MGPSRGADTTRPVRVLGVKNRSDITVSGDVIGVVGGGRVKRRKCRWRILAWELITNRLIWNSKQKTSNNKHEQPTLGGGGWYAENLITGGRTCPVRPQPCWERVIFMALKRAVFTTSCLTGITVTAFARMLSITSGDGGVKYPEKIDKTNKKTPQNQLCWRGRGINGNKTPEK